MVIYPGSPLHKLAGTSRPWAHRWLIPGLPEPPGEIETKSDPWSRNFDSQSKPKPKTEQTKTMINGFLVKKPMLEPESPAMSDEAILAMLSGRNGDSGEDSDAYMDGGAFDL